MKSNIATLPMPRPYSTAAERVEALPFRIRLAESTQDLLKAVEIRSAAYGRHVPEIGASLREPEPDDRRSDALLVIAESKLDQRVIGSLRLQPNFDRPLRIESAMSLPDSHKGRRLVEGRRLGVENGTSGRMVMVAIVKAAFELCHASGIDYVIVAGRRSVAAMYRSMLFDDLLDGGSVALSYAANLPHNVFSMPVREADLRWREAHHSLYDFMARTSHPDIQIDLERVLSTFA